MDELIGLLAALLFWRAVLAAVTGLSAALLLALVVPGFGAGMVALVTLVSFTVGMVWHAAAASPPPPSQGPNLPPPKPVSRPLAFAGIAVMGVTWGGVAHYAVDSTLLALLLLVAVPFVLGPLAGLATRTPAYLTDLLFTSLALATGFLAPLAIARLFS